jgi:ankyrin repeat protein
MCTSRMIYGWTALNVAAANASAEICKLLLDAGANVLKHDKNRNTPLHLAAQCAGNIAVGTLKVLLENGADLMLTNKERQIPLDVARGRGREYLEKLTEWLQEGAV